MERPEQERDCAGSQSVEAQLATAIIATGSEGHSGFEVIRHSIRL
jgi:hypothetical protein